MQKKKIKDEALGDECTGWMAARQWKPQAFQLLAWNAYAKGKEGLVNAPTGSGKTYSLLLPFILEFAKKKGSRKGLQALWITPIRALAKEIQIAALRITEETGIACSVGIRTGDTGTEERAAQRRESPNILITTPESLHLMLARKDNEQVLKNLRLIVADEWHELIGTKRGVMMELAIARLKSIAPDLRIWGISATIGNMDDAMHMLLGPDRMSSGVLIRSSVKKEIEVISLMPDEVERMPWAGHLGLKMIDRVLPVIHESKSTLIFTNVRSQCETWYRTLLMKDPSLAGIMAMHHGSISRELRHWVEDALYEGKLKAVVCTSSLDLGVDFAPVETIIQIGGPKGVARFMQRAGRSGHRPTAASRIYFLPTHSLELIEAAALRQAVKDEYLEERIPMTRCFDVLVQFLVTLSLGSGFKSDRLYADVKNTLCYADITEDEWKWVMAFVTTGGLSLSAYHEYRKVIFSDGLYKVADQRIARRHRLSIGVIVSDTMMAVKYKRGGLIGHIEESFIASLNDGDSFWFAGLSLQLISTKELTAFVKKSDNHSGKIPSWQGGKLPLSSRMSDMLRRKLTEAALPGPYMDPELEKIQPIIRLQKERSHVPAENEFLIEIFETSEGHHALFYPFEGRFVHEGMASLFAYRIGQIRPISISLAYNDYGFELLSDQPIPVEEALGIDLLDFSMLEADVLRGVNATELARRKFREIAAISGLVFKGFPGQPVKDRHLQSSAQLIFNVFQDYDPDNLLMRQAYDEVIHYQLEMPRLRAAMQRIFSQKIEIRYPEVPTPFAFPIMVDRLRAKMSSESLEERVKKLSIGFG